LLGPAGLGQLTAVLAALAFAGCAELDAERAERGPEPGPERGALTTVRVTKHTDGDTLWLSHIGKVRLIGVDTPEVYPRSPAPAGQRAGGGVECYGREASAFVERTAPLGSQVRYRLGVEERDRYGRALAYVWLRDGRFLNRLLVARGYAQPMTVPPNVEYEDVFAKAAAQARAAGRGLWGREGCAGA
jgi:micrococcal nuclease